MLLLVASVCGAHLACGQSAPMNERFQQATQAMRAGHLDEAAQGFQAVTAAQPGFAEAHFNLGLVLEEQGRNEQAIASFQKALC